jgi:hypothetical protein
LVLAAGRLAHLVQTETTLFLAPLLPQAAAVVGIMMLPEMASMGCLAALAVAAPMPIILAALATRPPQVQVKVTMVAVP